MGGGAGVARPPTEWDWKRIGEAVIDRRVELGYVRREDFLAAFPDVKQTFLAEIEQGKPGNRHQANLSALRLALEWPAGEFERIGTGVGGSSEVAALRQEVARLRAVVEGLLGPLGRLPDNGLDDGSPAR